MRPHALSTPVLPSSVNILQVYLSVVQLNHVVYVAADMVDKWRCSVYICDGRAHRRSWRRTSTQRRRLTVIWRRLVKSLFTALLRYLLVHSTTYSPRLGCWTHYHRRCCNYVLVTVTLDLPGNEAQLSEPVGAMVMCWWQWHWTCPVMKPNCQNPSARWLCAGDSETGLAQ